MVTPPGRWAWWSGDETRFQPRMGTECGCFHTYREMGSHLSHKVALPLHRVMANRWKRWLIDSAGGEPDRWPMRRPMLEMVMMASSLQPPRDSATRGMKDTPTAQQSALCAAIFRASPVLRACPWMLAAFSKVRGCSIFYNLAAYRQFFGRSDFFWQNALFCSF